MLREVLEWLRVKPDGTYIDATVGAGGHSQAIAGKLASGRLISLDRDAQALAMARERLKTFGAKVTVVHAPFSRIAEVAPELGIPPADGVLADLDRKSTRLNSSHSQISYAVFCLKKKKEVATVDLA